MKVLKMIVYPTTTSKVEIGFNFFARVPPNFGFSRASSKHTPIIKLQSYVSPSVSSPASHNTIRSVDLCTYRR
jgi:hypothetical protein